MQYRYCTNFAYKCVVWGSLTLCNCIKKLKSNMKEIKQPFLFLSQGSLRMILVALSHTGAKISLTVP